MINEGNGVNGPKFTLFAVAFFCILAVSSFNGANATGLISSAIGQQAYSQTTTVPLAYRVIIGIVLIVAIVVLVWKALKYFLGAIFIIIILLIIASTTYYIFKTGTISIANSMQFLVIAAGDIARYLPIPNLYSSAIVNNTSAYSNGTVATPYISASQAMLLLGTQNISNSSLQVYSNYSSRSALFGSAIPASNFTEAWKATYSWENRSISEMVLLANNTNASRLIYLRFSSSISTLTGAFTDVANNMQYTCYTGNSTTPILLMGGFKNRYVVFLMARNALANYSEISAIVSNDLG